ncbi:MAG: GNAT family N-acetyltransferase [Bacteroidales bacterium]|nr:GNAT family N-acetyltransferase [Bacteroidales bacterium]MCM1146693.1 GNAT family N-acetyltransferase [Bacteroidales bacterium]MCM1205510.1 GNAT family N-acetyltransferase [Bacillota bacterium]MCM1509229.1 GNAT family N-acetyltransferase [Clostridium sp.]
MRLEQINTNVKEFLSLLLLGDEQESMIDRYLNRGEIFVMRNDKSSVVCIAVVTDEGNGVCELKNIAVIPELQRQGYGKKMIEYLCRHYSKKFSSMTVGTGDSMQTVSFYKNCGFKYSHSIQDFFTIYYDHPIIEDGKALKDMLYFRKYLETY